MPISFSLPLDCANMYPSLHPYLLEKISSFRKKAKKIISFNQQDSSASFFKKPLAIIVGPCSIHEESGALAYAKKLIELQKEVEPHLFLVMRAYIEKSRSHLDWKGYAYDPYLTGTEDLESGIIQSYSLLTALTEMGIPLAIEFIDPTLSYAWGDFATWGFIGARTSSSPTHRSLASRFDFPVGFKNSIDGNVLCAVQGADTARFRHSILTPHGICKTEGNPWTHIVLRGGELGPNYDLGSIREACSLLSEYQMSSHVMIDCGHGNSGKQAEKQKEVFATLMDDLENGKSALFGIMLESYLEKGHQRFFAPTYSQSTERDPPSSGISITDPCLSWAETEKLLLQAASIVQVPNTISMY